MATAPVPLFDASATLRRLRDDEAPYPGMLQATAPPTVWVELAAIPEVVWRCAPDGHLLAPVDLARTRGGHDAVLPHCPQRLADAVRAGASPGQIVTVAVSMLRAAEEARSEGIECGSWWLDASGRPVLAAGGDRAWSAEGVPLLRELAATAAAPLRDAIDDVAALLGRSRCPIEDVIACEDALFTFAEPAPLGALGAAAPAAGVLPTDLTVTALAPRRAESVRREVGTVEEVAAWPARIMDAEWAVRVTAALRGVLAAPAALRGVLAAPAALRDRMARKRPEKTRAPRRALWAVAAGAAAVVIVVGLAWPEDRSTAVSAASPMPTDATGPVNEGEPVGEGEPAPATADPATADPATADPATAPTGDDLDAAADAALREIGACAAASGASCPDVMEDPGAPVPEGAVATSGATATMLDEYGGVAVYRVEAAGADPQILVLVSSNGKWLVRDVYDVADQP